jgi:hypothetical protein
MDNLGVKFFTDAKARFETAGLWRCVMVALLAYLHVGLVAPFAAYTREKAEIDRQHDDYMAAEGALKSVVDSSGVLATTINEAKNEVAKHLKDELVERFKRLSRVTTELAALDPSEAEGERGAALFENTPLQSVQQQMTAEDQLALVPMRADLRRQIAKSAGAVGQGEVARELQNYVDSEVIEPALRHAKSDWASSGLKFAQDGAPAIAEGIAKAKAVVPDATELDRLGKSVEMLQSEAQGLNFAPPPNPNWWRTTGGKETSISQMTSGLAGQVSAFFTNQMALQDRTTQIADLVGKNHRAIMALNDKLTDLDKRASDLQSQLGEIGAPLKVISFKLSEIAPLMPLIVAVTLATLAVWTAQGLRRMTLAAGLVDDEADGIAIRKWLREAAGGSHIKITAVELALTIACVAWVLVAAWNVASLRPPPFSPRSPW